MTTRTLAMEMRAIVDEAKRRGKSVTREIMWGLLSRDVPEESFRAELGRFMRAGWIKSVPGKPRGQGGGRGRAESTYEPGPVPVPARAEQKLLSRSMGNRAMLRLIAARKAARAWKREGTR